MQIERSSHGGTRPLLRIARDRIPFRVSPRKGTSRRMAASTPNQARRASDLLFRIALWAIFLVAMILVLVTLGVVPDGG